MGFIYDAFSYLGTTQHEEQPDKGVSKFSPLSKTQKKMNQEYASTLLFSPKLTASKVTGRLERAAL